MTGSLVRSLLQLVGALALPAAHAAGTLTVCTENAPDGFDIAQSESAVTHDAAGMTLYDQLVMYRRGTAELVPGLAERWETSTDGLQLTMHLRHGVRFHRTPWFKPSREMNADDVVFSIRRMAEPAGPWQAISPNGYLMWAGTGLAAQMKAIDKVDDYTVRFSLNKPSAPFVTGLAQTFTGSVFSLEYAQQLLAAHKLDRFNSEPVGTGPFVFQSYQKDAVIRYTPNPDYWGGASTLDRLVFAITPDGNVRVQRLKAGECLVGANMRAETAGAFTGTPVRMPGVTGLLTSYIALNTRRPFLDDPRFRQALALGFDRASYLAAVYGGRATPATSFLPSVQWSFDKTIQNAFDPARARALVQASGYDGRELSIYTRIGGSIDGKRAAELMQSDWARIGVNTRVQMMEWGEMLKRTGQGEHDITFLSWAGSGDPDDFFSANLSCAAVSAGGNKSLWCDAAFDALLDAARISGDRARRTALYEQAQRMVAEKTPVIPTVYPTEYTAVNQKVQGFVPSPLVDLDFRNVSLP